MGSAWLRSGDDRGVFPGEGRVNLWLWGEFGGLVSFA